MAAAAKKKVRTGHCSLGNHEATKPVSASGTPMPACTFWDTCACECHEQITQMYKMAGLDREPPEQNPAYLAWIEEQRRQFRMPSYYDGTVLGILSSGGAPDDPDIEEGPSAGTGDAVTGTPAPPSEPVFAPTPTGRRARGQLEYDVLAVCTDYAAGVFDWPACTPKLVSEEIGRREAVEPPSTGAINAVWDRWERLEFAVQDKKPSRFVKFTGGHSIRDLEVVKSRFKREKKRVEAATKRDPLAARRR